MMGVSRPKFPKRGNSSKEEQSARVKEWADSIRKQGLLYQSDKNGNQVKFCCKCPCYKNVELFRVNGIETDLCNSCRPKSL